MMGSEEDAIFFLSFPSLIVCSRVHNWEGVFMQFHISAFT